MKNQLGHNPAFPIAPLKSLTTPADFFRETALPFLEDALSFGNGHDLLVLNPHPLLSDSLPDTEDRPHFSIDLP